MNKIKLYLYQIIDKKYFLPVLNASVFALLYLFLIIPEQHYLNGVNAQHVRVNHEYQQQTLQIQQMAKAQQKLIALEKQWFEIKANGLMIDQIDNVFTELESLAKQAHVNIVYEAQDGLIKVTLKSDYLSLLYFLNSLIRKPYFLLENIQLKRDANWISTTFYLHILLNDDHV